MGGLKSTQKVITRPKESTPRCLPKRAKPHVYTKMRVWAFSSIIHYSPKVEKNNCPSTDERMGGVWPSHTPEHYSAMKRNKVLTQTITWVIPEPFLLSEGSQTQKAP